MRKLSEILKEQLTIDKGTLTSCPEQALVSANDDLDDEKELQPLQKFDNS